MKFTVERLALVKMLEVTGLKSPSKELKDKEVKLSACAPRVFVEANDSVAGIEALVLEDGTCLLDYKQFLKLLKSYYPKKNITIAVTERSMQLLGSTRPVRGYSPTATPPGKFQVFQVTDDWLSEVRPKAGQHREVTAKLPNANKSVVEQKKVLDYLLNSEHQIGASKANFFVKFGFSADKWEQLAEALRIHGQTHPVTKVSETGFGPRYEVEGKLDTPDGRKPLIRSVWQLDKGAVAPRLITAYPLEVR